MGTWFNTQIKRTGMDLFIKILRIVFQVIIVVAICASVYVALTVETSDNIIVLILFPIGALILIGVTMVLFFAFIGICSFLLRLFFGWVFGYEID